MAEVERPTSANADTYTEAAAWLRLLVRSMGVNGLSRLSGCVRVITRRNIGQRAKLNTLRIDGRLGHAKGRLILRPFLPGIALNESDIGSDDFNLMNNVVVPVAFRPSSQHLPPKSAESVKTKSANNYVPRMVPPHNEKRKQAASEDGGFVVRILKAFANANVKGSENADAGTPKPPAKRDAETLRGATPSSEVPMSGHWMPETWRGWRTANVDAVRTAKNAAPSPSNTSFRWPVVDATPSATSCLLASDATSPRANDCLLSGVLLGFAPNGSASAPDFEAVAA